MAKDCAAHGHHRRHKLYRRIFAGLLLLVILILLAVLIVWLVLRPTKPRFLLQDATIYALNFSSPGLLTTTLQVTVASRNPNDRVGVYYDRLDVYAAYKGQQVTAASAMPPGYQGHHDVVVWSPLLFGTSVPLAPYLSASLSQDQNAGFLLIYLMLDGKLRWKVGSWMSGHYHITVNCPAFFTVTADGSCRFQRITTCNVDV